MARPQTGSGFRPQRRADGPGAQGSHLRTGRDTGQQWADYIERQISDALAPFEEAVGCVIAEERQREREEIKAAVDRLDHELGKTIAVTQGKAEGRASAIENRLEREVREMQQRVAYAEKQMNEARMELLNLASEFRAILNDAAEAQRAMALALVRR